MSAVTASATIVVDRPREQFGALSPIPTWSANISWVPQSRPTGRSAIRSPSPEHGRTSPLKTRARYIKLKPEKEMTVLALEPVERQGRQGPRTITSSTLPSMTPRAARRSH